MPALSIIPARAVGDENLTGADIRVLCAIGIHTDAKTGEGCWARAATLALEAGVSKNQFFTSARRLLDGNYIRRESGQADGVASSYSIILDSLPTPKNGVPPTLPNSVPPHRLGGRQQAAAQGAPTINAPLNVPINAPNTARGGKLRAGELVKDVRLLRNPQFPTSLESGWATRFSADAVRVVRAVGIERILTTQPANDGPLLAQIASMLAEVA